MSTTTSISAPSVFDEYLFFGVWVSGVYALTALVPILPQDFFARDFLFTILMFFAVAFAVGMMVTVLSERVERTGGDDDRNGGDDDDRNGWLKWDSLKVDHPEKTLLEIVNNRERDRHGTLIKNIIKYCSSLGVCENKCTGEEYEYKEIEMLYQYLLSVTWRQGNSLPRLLFTIRAFCRNMVILSIFLVITGIIASIGIIFADIHLYDPVYESIIDRNNPIARYLVAISIIVPHILFFVAFRKGHDKFAGYQISYMISTFVVLYEEDIQKKHSTS